MLQEEADPVLGLPVVLLICTTTMPSRISPMPATRHAPAGLCGSRISPRWSIASDASIWPAMTHTMKLAAPSFGVSINAAVM